MGMVLEINGSYLEGGGQIIRTAVALSAITKTPVKIYDIRRGREKPGLKPQHLEAIRTAARICQAETAGLQLDSTELIFIPGKINGGLYTVDTKTAGAITLILQLLTPIAIFADRPLKLDITGGTAVPYSPNILYFAYVFCYYLEKMGMNIEVDVKKHGFYPRGGGNVVVSTNPGSLIPCSFVEPGSLKQIKALVICSDHLRNARVAERLAISLQNILPEAKTKYQYVTADSPGCFIQVLAIFENAVLGFDGLGARGKPAEKIGNEVGELLKKFIAGPVCLDPWMIDQIIPYLALATAKTGEKTEVKFRELTMHAQTNSWVTKQFLPVDFEVSGNILTCVKAD